MILNINVNGKKYSIETNPNARLLDIIRDRLNLTGTKEGCSIGECGACTVILNGKAVNSCMMLAFQVQNSVIETIEYVDDNYVLKLLKEKFLQKGAVQCGFCTPGMIMSAKALLDTNPNPSLDEIKTALEGNLCRCTGYKPILDAVTDTVRVLKDETDKKRSD